jgi:MFS superfamily sulfate permease-like transporter
MLLLVIYQATRPSVSVLGKVPGLAGAYGDVERHPEYGTVPGVLLLRLDAPLFYANAAPMRDRIKKLVGRAQPLPHTVILDTGANDALDVTAAEALEEIAHALHSAGIELVLADVHSPVARMAGRARVIETIGSEHVFHTVDDAVRSSR